mmetsp:Transcript_19153/g.29498  ORF Transcript_19153/g.29498 Transcript_19153/m.29498 type:complete len:436 (+) Transcript_19153:119-1426(+)|eukprot:CAMPEP_0195286864 /NCGR_PEP_ID=MMETSP0707-20130614/4164_1 /TAXON_ID=33640 /ORGANISM="Asterionellopsis glacialis, Strain CCMP134" /LENGTH=435 /DNA_ID=CAMNT_0040346561 /DNA_START=160 /DNA_END=1467 /DNA_ORIENTATION=-
MANNGGRQGGGGGNGQMNEHVEFTVKAEEDLYLTGSENTIRRVTAETNYSCLMLKTQRFSSLFRHYAKYHGLRKDDLEYYFVNPLENEDTPESVQLQRGDTIMVRKKRKPEPPEASADDDEFFKDMKELLDDEEHMDAMFEVHPEGGTPEASNLKSAGDNKDGSQKPPAENNNNSIQIRAHKCILTARAEYFKALFRKGTSASASSKANIKASERIAFRESSECIIKVEPYFSPNHIRHMLEFLYTNRISALHSITTDDLLCLLHLSDRWLLRDLKRLVEHELIRNHMEVHTVARMYCATEDYNAHRLSKACIDFIMANIRQVTGNAAFQEEMKHYPHLCIPVLKAAADLIPEGPLHKKQRLSENLVDTTSSKMATTPSGSSSAAAAAHAAAAAAGGAQGAGGAGSHAHAAAAAAGAQGGGGGVGSSSPVPDSDP